VRRVLCGCLLLGSLVAAPLIALTPEVLSPTRAVAPHVAGRFRDVRAFQQTAAGQHYIFDRRAHRVFGVDDTFDSAWQIVQIGAEPGRIIGPTAFSTAPDGRFAVADAPAGRPRIQIFNAVGFRVAGFTLPDRARARVASDDTIVNGIASILFTGSTILISQPENGALVTEYALSGQEGRSFGELRPTGQEQDRDLHLALNSGIPLVDPAGGFLFVFHAGVPVYRKYDAVGRLVFERRMQGIETDALIGRLPTRWSRQDDELPVVRPTVRAAAVDRHGQLWVSFADPFTYVFDTHGDKIRTVQFRGVGLIAPAGLHFTTEGRLLVTPGLYEFDPGPRAASRAPGERP
jgi:hypothetical protein